MQADKRDIQTGSPNSEENKLSSWSDETDSPENYTDSVVIVCTTKNNYLEILTIV